MRLYACVEFITHPENNMLVSYQAFILFISSKMKKIKIINRSRMGHKVQYFLSLPPWTRNTDLFLRISIPLNKDPVLVS